MEIYSINISQEKGTPKSPVFEAELKEAFGIEGDVHAGMKVCQVSLLAQESVDRVNRELKEKEEDFVLTPGIFAENLTTRGVDLSTLELGDRLCFDGGAVLEISQKGKTCHGKCSVFYRTGDCIMPRECVFAVVKKSGRIQTGHKFKVLTKN